MCIWHFALAIAFIRVHPRLNHSQWNIPRLKSLLEEILPNNTHFEDFVVELVADNGDREKILLAINDMTGSPDAEVG
jgi:hypothetical protein